MNLRHDYIHPAMRPLVNAMAPAPHSTPVDSFPEWRAEQIRHKYTDPHEWDAELNSDGEIDDVELEESGESEEWS